MKKFKEITDITGFKYTYPESVEFIKKYGSPETLAKYTNNQKWAAYFPKGNFTVEMNKETSLIEKVLQGKKL